MVSDDLNTSGGVAPATRSILGWASYALGLVLAFATGFGFIALLSQGGLDPIVSAIVLVLLLLLAITLLVMTEGFLVPGCREVCPRDPRPPVLFLRSFGEDEELTYDVISTGESSSAVTAKAEDFLLALNAVGPLISIGQPTWASRLGLYPHGAFRDYVGHGQWQGRVQELLDRAGMVVLTVGDTPGLEWEIAQVRERIGPRSLLLYLPPRPVGALTRAGRERKERAIYEHFRPMVEHHFDIRLPPFREALYVIGFDANGEPVTAETPPKRWVWTEHGRVMAAITAQLKAVMQRVRPDVDLTRYVLPGRVAMGWRIVLAVALLVLGGLLGGVGYDAEVLFGLTLQALPGLILIVGWVLLARHFARPWVWVIPILLALMTAVSLGMQAALRLDWAGEHLTSLAGWANAAGLLLNFVYALAVLVLGVLVGRRS